MPQINTDRPAAWDEMIESSETYEDAQTQLLYLLNLQMLKHRNFVRSVVIAVVALLAFVAVVSLVLVLSTSVT
jgi:hypothetical protein